MAKKRKANPVIKEIDAEELAALLERLREAGASEKDCEMIESVAEAIKKIKEKLSKP